MVSYEQMAQLTKSIAVLFSDIQANKVDAFNALFLDYYPRLVTFAQQYVKQLEVAEEVVSSVFVKLWQKRSTLTLVSKPEVYLYISVKNASFNHIRDHKKRQSISLDSSEISEASCIVNTEDKELTVILKTAVSALPEQRQLIFKLIKEDGLKSREVAEILEISPRTVESQLYKAIKFLADQLSDYLGYHPQKQTKRRAIILKFIVLW